MGIHATSFNGMGSVSESSPGVFTTTGMKAEDHLHISQDSLSQAGIVNPEDLFVQENGTPNMSVLVDPGTFYVLNDSYVDNSTSQNKFWRAISDSQENPTIAVADGANPRIDLVVAKVNSAGTPSDEGADVITIESSGDDANLAGTPAGSPSAPTLPANCLLLAYVYVGAGVTSITDANITDARSLVSFQRNDYKGWSELPGTWTRVSNTEMQAPANYISLAGIISVGDKIRLYDGAGTSYEYFYITNVTATNIKFNAPSATLAGTPSNIWFSKEKSPAGWTVGTDLSFVELFMTADENITLSTATKIDNLSDASGRDLNNEWDNGTATFTAKQKGLYKISFLERTKTSVGSVLRAYIYINGATYNAYTMQDVASANQSILVTAETVLDIGDTVEFYAYSNGAGTATIDSNVNATTASIRLIERLP